MSYRQLPINNFLALLLLCTFGCASKQTAPESVSVHLTRSISDEWTVAYQFSRKAGRLAFARNPEVSRITRWEPNERSIEIVQINGEDMVRRRDGRPFDRVQFRLTPTYRHLGKEYAPFASFSDGGILVHTGRYFACLETCENKEPTWQFSLTDVREHHVLVRGALHNGRATWTDSMDGIMVYVGKQVPIETSRAWIIIDPAFPQQVVELLNQNLPGMVDYFSTKFGELRRKPSLFASYDEAHANSSGSEGGTLPDQIFMHFFGSSLEKRLSEPDSDLWLSWFFAHEAAHLHQTDSDEAESWIHEGAADAFAAIVLRGWSDRSHQYVRARRDEAAASCRHGLQSRALEAVAESGEFPLYYSCGLILHLALDDVVRRRNSDNDGLFAIWKAYESEITLGSEPNGSTYRKVVSDLAGNDVAAWVKEFTTKPMPRFWPAEPAY